MLPKAFCVFWKVRGVAHVAGAMERIDLGCYVMLMMVGATAPQKKTAGD